MNENFYNMGLIDKAEVIKNIEELDEFWHLSKSPDGQAFIESLLSFLNDIEEKEVDLEKEIQNIIHKRFHDYYGIVNSETGEFANVNDMVTVAKYFYQLGLKTKEE